MKNFSIKIMKDIKRRRKKDWNLTKKQIEFISDYHIPNYKNDCGHCKINLDLSLGLLSEFTVNAEQ